MNETRLSPSRLARRERIVDAAELVFRAAGFRGASMEAIASAAGMSKVTVYGYFPDKEAAFLAVATRFAARLRTAFFEALDGPGTIAARIAAALSAKHLAVAGTVRSSTEAGDLFAAQARIASGVYTALDRELQGAIAGLLAAHGTSEPARLAAILFAAANGMAGQSLPAELPADIGLLVERMLGES